MDLKTILNNVLAQSGFLERGGFTTSADPDDKQMVAIANRVAYEIMNYYRWPELRKASVINLQSGQDRYKLPNDFQDFVPNSAWEGEGERQVEWPVPNNRWYLYKFSAYSDGGTYRVKKYGDEIEVRDAETGNSFDYEYVSKWVIEDSQGARKEFFTQDTDKFLLDDQTLILGIQAHWQQSKQMQGYQEHFANYRTKLTEAIARASGGTTIGGASGGGDWIASRSPYYPLYRRT
jgi:hypothetical protein